jgi:uncharacterized protein YdeI (YjbR/CyaY-like superfamily)
LLALHWVTDSAQGEESDRAMASENDLQRLEVRNSAEWRDWLCKHHQQSGSIWVVTWKKGRGPYVPYGDLRDEALCFGWIDSRPAKLDAARSMLLMSPRKPGSGWSDVNKKRIEALEASGRMADPGRAKMLAACKDGSWHALDAAHALVIPNDLTAALAQHPSAAERFAGFPPSARRGILEWIAVAKLAETRARRVAETARLAAQGIRANHPGSRSA